MPRRWQQQEQLQIQLQLQTPAERGDWADWRRAPLEFSKLLGTLLGAGDPQRLLLVVVEIARIAGTLTPRNERRLDFLLEDRNPVGGGEPLLVLNIIDARLQIAVALGQVHLQQVAQ